MFILTFFFKEDRGAFNLSSREKLGKQEERKRRQGEDKLNVPLSSYCQ